MAKKTLKSNKTSHVMNLLTSGLPEEEQREKPEAPEAPAFSRSSPGERSAAESMEAEISSGRAASEKPAGRVTVIDEATENDRLSAGIKRQLEETLARSDEPKEPEFHIVNVLWEILKQKDMRGYIRQYGGCSCDRCVADVTALCLTRLPSKYVVLEKDKTSPMIGFYQSKYQADIFTSILKSCIVVKEHPHHGNRGGADAAGLIVSDSAPI